MAPAVEDLAIEPSEGATTLLHGYLGVTPTLKVSGRVTFTATKSLSLTHVRITLIGDLVVTLSLTDGPRSTKIPLLGGKKLLVTGPETQGKKDKGVPIKSGPQSYPFEFDVPPEKVAELPASMRTAWGSGGGHSGLGADSVNIWYRLEAEVGVAPGMFGSTTKVEKVTEDVDFPRINVPNVLRSRSVDTSVLLAGSNERLEWRIEIDRGIFGIGDPVTFLVHHIRPADPRTTITSVTVGIRQDVVLAVDGNSRTVREYISLPDVAGKLLLEGTRDHGAFWRGTVVAGVQAQHQRSKDHKAVDAFPAIELDCVAVRHWFEVCVKIKGEADFRAEAPAVYIDADKEVRDWVVRNAAAIKED
ncbi:hypothetical protein HK101_004545 [Irineochytrium annulatum]|nr:hypothetical protein HK101_004545 [Irineochytrium annulatum]